LREAPQYDEVYIANIFHLQVFVEDLQKDKLWEIMEKIMEVYEKEPDSK
jgi:hypothetical protein